MNQHVDMIMLKQQFSLDLLQIPLPLTQSNLTHMIM